ncbi:MAG: Signal transduction histidine kinase [Betaproteobacteria bacterium HGW-Betaproteobacteria-8]|nr:MAG: Signal transduction histidine kinase [Betaproteobacteria bacterium HGW-Betaproteobacteria-8]
MKFLTLALLFILAAIAVFIALNWGAFVAPADLSLGFTVIQMPFGMVMLGFLVFVTVLFLIYAVTLQTSALLEVRRYSRDLQTSRELADKAEASRFTELRIVLEAEMLKQADQYEEFKTSVFAKVDQLGAALHFSLEESTNSLAACIGELEDRIDRARGG